MPPASAAEDRWEWTVHEQGYEFGLNALGSSGSLLVAVGESGQIVTSSDGLAWTRCPTRTIVSLLDVAWSGSVFVAVGSNGTILHSTDGMRWSRQVSGTTSTLSKIAWNGSRFYVSGGGGGISADGINWSFGVSSAPAMADLAADGSRFIGVSGRKAYVSTDGVNWSSSTITTDTSIAGFLSIARSGGAYYAAAEQRIYASPDAQTWSLSSNAWRQTRLVGNATELFALGNYILALNQDKTWKLAYQAFSDKFRDALWSGTRYVVLDGDGRLATSADLQGWTFPIHNTLTESVYSEMNPVKFGSRIVSAGKVPGPYSAAGIYSSTDGRLWDLQAGALGSYYALVAAGDRLLAASSDKLMLESFDGATWHPLPQGPSAATYLSIAWTGEQFFGLTSGQGLHSSANGSDWQMILPDASLVGASRLLWNGNLLIAVGTKSYSSPDGQHWSPGGTGPGSTAPLVVVWNGTRFVAVAGGELYSSDDGLQWSAAPDMAPELRCVATSGPATVAVGYWSNILHSADGLNWTDVSPTLGADYVRFQSVVWDGSRFIASSPTIALSSADGINWAAVGPGPRYDVAADGSQFVAVGATGRVSRSADGINWQPHNLHTLADLKAVSFVNGTWFAAGTKGSLYRSQDGRSWTSANAGIGTATLGKVSWNSTVYLVPTAGSGCYTSPDGWSWTFHSTPDAMAWTASDRSGFRGEYGGSSDGYSAGYSLQSPDGVTWSRVNSRSKLTGATYGGGLFVATTAGGEILTSTDGDTWTTCDTPTRSWLQSVVWTGNMYVAVGFSGTVLKSADGLAWQKVNAAGISATESLNYVVWTGSRLVAVAGSSKIFVSTNATTWSEATNPSGKAMDTIAWSGSMLVAVGSSGAIITSPDGQTWTKRTSNTTASLWGVTWTGSQFVAVGNSGTIVTSPDGIVWTPRTSGVGSSFSSVASNGTRIVAAGSNRSVVGSDDGVNWSPVDTGVGGFDAALGAQGRIYLFGLAGALLASADGSDWTILRRGSAGTPLEPVLVGTDTWEADYGWIYYVERPDLVWKQRQAISVSILDFHWTGTSFVAVGYSGGATTSPNGIDWAESLVPTGDHLVAAASTPARVVVVGRSGTIASAANSARPLSGIGAWRRARELAVGADAGAAQTCGLDDLIAYGLAMPFSPCDGPAGELTPHPLADGRRGLAFGVPVVDRPDLRYVVEESNTMESGSWVEIARKDPGQPWTGSATITAGLLADYWFKVIVTDTNPPAPRRFYRVEIDYLDRVE